MSSLSSQSPAQTTELPSQAEHRKVRVNYSYFYRCSRCPLSADCPHLTAITVEPTLSKTERRPKQYHCFSCGQKIRSALQLFKHLLNEHQITTRFRCAKCHKADFTSFAQASHHRRFCDNTVPDPTSRKRPPFEPTPDRPALGAGLLRDISSVSDERFLVTATHAFTNQATLNELWSEYTRILAKDRPRRQGRRRSRRGQRPGSTSLPGRINWSVIWNATIRGSVQSAVNIERAHNYFSDILGTRAIDRLNPISVHPLDSTTLLEYIDNADISHHLSKKAKSTPGLDRISALELAAHPMLTRIVLNLCLWKRDIPDAWRESTTTLIPKKASVEPSDYRPITVGPMAYRTLTAILARRLQSRLPAHTCQKGFLPIDGVHEAVTVCRYLARTQYCIASLDVKRAFDGVCQDSVIAICKANGLTQADIALLKSLYRDCSTNLKVGDQLSRKIWVKSGVKQGDPLSPILFNLVVDQLLRRLESTNLGIPLAGRRLPCLGFADDLLLFGRSCSEIEELSAVVIAFYGDVGLSINAQKTVLYGSNRPALIDGQLIAPVDSFRYLGATIDRDGSCGYKPYQVAHKLFKVSQADLPPGHKLHLVRQHLLPELTHRLVHETTLAKSLAEIDKSVRKTIKRTLGLHTNTANSFFYLKVKSGGLGLSQLRYDIPRLALTRMLRLAASESWYVRHVASTRWYSKEIARLNRLCPSDNDNQTRLLNDITKFDPGHINYRISGTLTNRHLLGTTDLATDQFLQIVQLRGGMISEPDDCIHCNTPQSAFHLLNVCPLTRPLQRARHDKALSTIVSHIESTANLSAYREQRLNGPNGTLIPDLIVVHATNSTAFIMDVGISYEKSKQSLDNYDACKRAKYRPVESETIQWLHQHGHPHVDKIQCYGLIFGSRGAIQNVCLNILKDTLEMPLPTIESTITQIALDSHNLITQHLPREGVT